MPTISFFYGLVIQMFWEKFSKHHKPHIHVKYAEFYAVYDIEEISILEGNLPLNKKRLVEAWISIHQEELLADWSLAVTNQDLFKIEPLK